MLIYLLVFLFLCFNRQKKTHHRDGLFGVSRMKIVQNRKEWRHNTVMRLIENLKIDADAAVAEAKKIEKYVFQNDFIVEIDSEDQKQALENLIKSLKRD